MNARILSRSWLWRELEVVLPEGDFHVAYSGRGFGFETVYVDDDIAERKMSPLWFVPVFVFPIGERLGVVEVRVWPWLTLRSFHLLIDGEVVYAEGKHGKPHIPPAWIEDVRRRWEATGRVSREITEKLSQLPNRDGIRGAGKITPGDGGRRE